MNISKTSIVVLAALVGGFYYFNPQINWGSITLIPPTKSDVRDVLNRSDPRFNHAAKTKLTRESIHILSGCSHVAGGVIQEGIYSCKVEFIGRTADIVPTLTIKITKKLGKWVLVK